MGLFPTQRSLIGRNRFVDFAEATICSRLSAKRHWNIELVASLEILSNECEGGVRVAVGYVIGLDAQILGA